MHFQKTNHSLLHAVKEIVIKAKLFAFRSSNSILLNMYWEIGRLIVEDEQQGLVKAEYGKALLKNLAKQLTVEFGSGFDERNLNNMRAFYLSFSIWNAVRTELSWTHYRIISRRNNIVLGERRDNRKIFSACRESKVVCQQIPPVSSERRRIVTIN